MEGAVRLERMSLKRFSIMLLLLLHILLNGVQASANVSCASILPSSSSHHLLVSGRVFAPVGALPDRIRYIEIDYGREVRSVSLRVLENPNFDGFLISGADIRAMMQNEELRLGLLTGLKTIHLSYKPRMAEEVIKLVTDLDFAAFERDIVSYRLGYVLVRSRDAKEPVYDVFETGNAEKPYEAFLRVFDGTDYKRLDGVEIGVKAETSYELPVESLIAGLGIQTSYFENLRNQGFRIFEIGKYYINPELTPELHRIARLSLLSWLYENYLDPSISNMERTIFVIDAGSLVHSRAYRVSFGAKKVSDDQFNPRLEPSDSVLYIPIDVLRARIEKVLKK